MPGIVRTLIARVSAAILRLFRNGHVMIRRGCPADADDFAELALLSSPTLFPAIYGDSASRVLRSLHRQPRNLFSCENALFAELSGKNVGMLLAYDWRTRREQNWRTGLLLLRELKFGIIRRAPGLLRSRNAVGDVPKGEVYISNVAVYTDHRGNGIGTRLIGEAQDLALRNAASALTLDVEADNHSAIRLYLRLGFSVAAERRLSLGGGQTLAFYRMRKAL